MTTIDEKKEFSKNMLDFYKFSLDGTAKSISALLEIQTNCSNAYEEFRKLKDDPLNNDITKNLPTEYKDKILILMLKSSKISLRLKNIMDSSIDDKKSIINDIKDYIAEIDSLKEMIKNAKSE